jgi:anaerobic selenocysteine-containing dehydrogenase
MGGMPINVFADEILTPGPGQIKALICVGGNPAVAFPNQRKVVEALRALELTVVLDVKITATAALAHYVVGCKLSLEKPGTSRTAELQLDVPFAQYTPALVQPSFDVVEDASVNAFESAVSGCVLAQLGTIEDGRIAIFRLAPPPRFGPPPG